ncbi:GNAT family N-acetyltransferase [Pseudokineococcus sp. 5B2Z-1]|uniref:GNAT family N-acetyltransferase n=1 Tax=Pseudokineococcus sp. 5B2Z-1 TaxID=3132744 RepID=UPI003096447B
MVTTRPARREDADALGAVHVTTWRSAYAGLIPRGHLDGLSPERSAARWREHLPCAPPETCLVSVDPRDRPTGFALAGPHREEQDPGASELYSLYVHPEHAGEGVGTVLLARTQELLGAAGFVRASLWVLTSNHGARRFYEHCGWSVDGRTRLDVLDETPLHETLMTTELS